ncbi:hypothetical protein RHABOEDO_001200 [Candidatus Rhabdochlamydia oedothoracis]|uniref:Homeodomain-like domain-containing protein n=1 Tax=Candidatus Rhabdochlamydia oedothoracis TaxID=2720720 RepID=A0ABX8V1C9_9BACT|nr:hypothetical protein RHABOEDO_001200 [Candidatus Rhabdochlamydia oedothoracis]
MGAPKQLWRYVGKYKNSQKSIAKLAEELSLNPKTVLKWRKRGFQHDAPMGTKKIHSTILSNEEEAIIVAFLKHTLLSLTAFAV